MACVCLNGRLIPSYISDRSYSESFKLQHPQQSADSQMCPRPFLAARQSGSFYMRYFISTSSTESKLNPSLNYSPQIDVKWTAVSEPVLFTPEHLRQVQIYKTIRGGVKDLLFLLAQSPSLAFRVYGDGHELHIMIMRYGLRSSLCKTSQLAVPHWRTQTSPAVIKQAETGVY